MNPLMSDDHDLDDFALVNLRFWLNLYRTGDEPRRAVLKLELTSDDQLVVQGFDLRGVQVCEVSL